VGEFRTPGHVDGDRYYASQDAPEERAQPFTTVLSPNNDSITFLDSAGFQETGAASGKFGDLLVSKRPMTEPLPVPDGDSCSMRPQILDQ
jgi:hypothetical protein